MFTHYIVSDKIQSLRIDTYEAQFIFPPLGLHLNDLIFPLILLFSCHVTPTSTSSLSDLVLTPPSQSIISLAPLLIIDNSQLYLVSYWVHLI